MSLCVQAPTWPVCDNRQNKQHLAALGFRFTAGFCYFAPTIRCKGSIQHHGELLVIDLLVFAAFCLLLEPLEQHEVDAPSKDRHHEKQRRKPDPHPVSIHFTPKRRRQDPADGPEITERT